MMAVEARPPQDVIREALEAGHDDAANVPTLCAACRQEAEPHAEDCPHAIYDRAADALAALVARVEQAERERDEAVELAQKSWDAAWTKARREWQSNVTEKLPAVEAERDRLAAALREIAEPQAWKRGDPAPFEFARAVLADTEPRT